MYRFVCICVDVSVCCYVFSMPTLAGTGSTSVEPAPSSLQVAISGPASGEGPSVRISPRVGETPEVYMQEATDTVRPETADVDAQLASEQSAMRPLSRPSDT